MQHELKNTKHIHFYYKIKIYTGCPKKKYSGLILNNFKASEAIRLK